MKVSALSNVLFLGSFALASAQQANLRGQRFLSSGISYKKEDDDHNYLELVHVDFNDLPTGMVLHHNDPYQGITFSSYPDSYRAMIFDSNNPTGGDEDLKDTEHLGLGKMLIYSEDGVSSNPDDNAGGGTLTLVFEETVIMDSIALKDNEEGVLIKLYDERYNKIKTVTAPIGKDGEDALVWLEFTKGVKIMKFHCEGSCAFPFIKFFIPFKPPVCPTPAPTPSPTPPPECDIELEQRVRVEPKPNDGTCICCDDDNFGKLKDGGSLRFVYKAGNTIISSQDSGKVKVEGTTPFCDDGPVRIIVSKKDKPFEANADETWFDGSDISCGDVFEPRGDFGGDTYIHVIGNSGVQTSEFHTSCSQPIKIGDVYGSSEVVGFTDEDGKSADGAEPNLGPGLFDKMYTSPPGLNANSGDTVVFTYIVHVKEGDLEKVSVTAFDTVNGKYEPKLVEKNDGKYIYVYSFTIPSVSYGGELEIEATSKADATQENGPPCEAEAKSYLTIKPPKFVGDVCETCGKPRALTWIFQPGNVDLTASDSKAELSGSKPADQPAYIVVSNKDDVEDVFFSGVVKPGERFRASVHSGADKFESNTYILVYGGESQGSGVVQTHQYHTSCSGTIKLGDVLGSIETVLYEGEDCNIGG